MRGTKDEAVVIYHKSFVTKKMQQDRLARRVKDVDYAKKTSEYAVLKMLS
jgi:hypothetical protein